ncbi:hypothetical protein ZWY2020_038129 [Hordeum vulgare]|nr:hypothetical protein ZWY2020_038129 [Hordeum vulgare]
MSRRGSLEKGTAKSDPIFHNRLVNMVINCIMKYEKNHWLIKFSIDPVTPNIGVKTRCDKKGSTQKFPIEIGSKQGRALVIHLDAAKGSGASIRKKEATHRMAEANIALAHFR